MRIKKHNFNPQIWKDATIHTTWSAHVLSMVDFHPVSSEVFTPRDRPFITEKCSILHVLITKSGLQQELFAT